MHRRRIADVLCEAPAWVQSIRVVHVAVARNLRDDRCGRDRGARGISVDNRTVWPLELGHGEAVSQAGTGSRSLGSDLPHHLKSGFAPR